MNMSYMCFDMHNISLILHQYEGKSSIPVFKSHKSIDDSLRSIINLNVTIKDFRSSVFL